jgi:hypothetical protein
LGVETTYSSAAKQETSERHITSQNHFPGALFFPEDGAGIIVGFWLKLYVKYQIFNASA